MECEDKNHSSIIMVTDLLSVVVSYSKILFTHSVLGLKVQKCQMQSQHRQLAAIQLEYLGYEFCFSCRTFFTIVEDVCSNRTVKIITPSLASWCFEAYEVQKLDVKVIKNEWSPSIWQATVKNSSLPPSPNCRFSCIFDAPGF